MKRKFAALLLSAAMLCTLLTGCSDSSSPTPSNPNPPASSSSGSTSTPSDDNNNNSGNDNNNSGNSNTTKPGDSDTDSATLPSVVPVITYNSVFPITLVTTLTRIISALLPPIQTWSTILQTAASPLPIKTPPEILWVL